MGQGKLIAAALPFLRSAGTILTFGITLPVWLFLAAGGWLYLDRGSAVRQAVDHAVTELVAGAELEAERAKSAALETINAELRGRANALALANGRFSQSLAAAQTSLESANGQIAELLMHPVNDACAVDPDILGRLRSN